MNASDILKENSTGFMLVGIGALKKLIKTLARYKEELEVCSKRSQLRVDSLKEANIKIEKLESELRELRNTCFRSQIITSIELDV